MKTKPIIISTMLGILAVSIYFLLNPKEPPIKDPEFNQSIKASHHLLRHWSILDIDQLDDFYNGMPDANIWNQYYDKNFLEALFHTIKEHATTDLDQYADWVAEKVNDERIKKDALRAEEFFYYAGKNKDILALGFSYMIYHDLDVQLNNYKSNRDLFGVTELQGQGGKYYDRMIRYYHKLKSND